MSKTCVHSQTLLSIEIFAAVCQEFNNAYPNKEEENKMTAHRLISKFGGTLFSKGVGHIQHSS
jgi:hypothetical protein